MPDEIKCPTCRKEVQAYLEQCPRCKTWLSSTGDKNWTVTLLLCLFFGQMGVHRFYTGDNNGGLAYIGGMAIGLVMIIISVFLKKGPSEYMFLAALGVWGFVYLFVLIDFLGILTGGFKDSDGRDLKK